MYPGQDDQTRRMGQQPDSRAYSQMGGGQGYDDAYGAGGYPPDGGYDQAPEPKRGPAVDVGKFVGSVVATALVAAIAGWLIAWVVGAVFDRFGQTWSNGGNTPTMYAIYGAVAAILAGLLWYLLLVARRTRGSSSPGPSACSPSRRWRCRSCSRCRSSTVWPPRSSTCASGCRSLL